MNQESLVLGVFRSQLMEIDLFRDFPAFLDLCGKPGISFTITLHIVDPGNF